MKCIFALSMLCLASGAVVKAAEVLRPRGVPLSSEFYVKNGFATSEECGQVFSGGSSLIMNLEQPVDLLLQRKSRYLYKIYGLFLLQEKLCGQYLPVLVAGMRLRCTKQLRVLYFGILRFSQTICGLVCFTQTGGKRETLTVMD